MPLLDYIPDYSDRENSVIPPGAIEDFRKWLNKYYARHPDLIPDTGTRDYDLIGAFLAGMKPEGYENGHLPDFTDDGKPLKKSNHISGSNNGRWFKARTPNGDKWVYEVAPTSMYSQGFYKDYFARNEPDAILIDDRRFK